MILIGYLFSDHSVKHEEETASCTQFVLSFKGQEISLLGQRDVPFDSGGWRCVEIRDVS